MHLGYSYAYSTVYWKLKVLYAFSITEVNSREAFAFDLMLYVYTKAWWQCFDLYSKEK